MKNQFKTPWQRLEEILGSIIRLKPPFELLKEIGYKETKTLGFFDIPKGIRVQMDLPTYPSKKFYRYISVMFQAALNEQFEAKLSKADPIEIQAHLNLVILGVLHNAAKHGNKNDSQKKIVMGLWLGEKGVLLGVRDEGDFFLRASVKKALKSKELFPTKKDPPDFFVIYDKCDNVCTFGGALYLTILTDSLVRAHPRK